MEKPDHTSKTLPRQFFSRDDSATFTSVSADGKLEECKTCTESPMKCPEHPRRIVVNLSRLHDAGVRNPFEPKSAAKLVKLMAKLPPHWVASLGCLGIDAVKAIFLRGYQGYDNVYTHLHREAISESPSMAVILEFDTGKMLQAAVNFLKKVEFPLCYGKKHRKAHGDVSLVWNLAPDFRFEVAAMRGTMCLAVCYGYSCNAPAVMLAALALGSWQLDDSVSKKAYSYFNKKPAPEDYVEDIDLTLGYIMCLPPIFLKLYDTVNKKQVLEFSKLDPVGYVTPTFLKYKFSQTLSKRPNPRDYPNHILCYCGSCHYWA